MNKEENQRKKFIKAAQELECDDDPEAFKKRLKRLMEAPASNEHTLRSSKKKSDKPK